MKAPEPNPWVFAIPEYVAGRSKEAISLEYGISNPIKLASNENPLGPSPKAMQALRKTLKSSHL
jgi:histidinol-phosphate aminotransferase